MKKLLACSFLCLINFFSSAQNTNISGIINDYTSVSNITGTTISVTSSAAFSPGDKVLLIQMQGATIDETNSTAFGDIINYNSAGNYEFTTICSIPGASEIAVNNIQRTYDPGGTVQLIRVPVYNDATVTAPLTAMPWNGNTGGVLVFECQGSLTLNDTVNLQGTGFTGAATTTSTYSCEWWNQPSDYFYNITTGEGALKGEGVAAYIAGKTAGRGAQANGGGGGNDHNTGGGGGGNGGSGGQGGDRIPQSTFYCSGTAPGVGGKPNVFNNSANKIYMGGAGGAGHENNVGVGTNGGNGGGIVIIKANTIIGNGQMITATGESAGLAEDGAGGGGSGGTVLLDVGSYTGAVNVDISGANGGDVNNVGPSNCNGPGGGGGGGVLWVSQPATPAQINLTNNGGISGTTVVASQTNCTVGSTNNAQDGSPGITVLDLILPQPTLPPSGIDVVTACDSLVWLDGNTYYANNNTATHTITGGASSGCDSTVVLDLTVISASSGTDNIVSCDSIEWIDGNTYYSSNNTATYTYIGGASSGCDSVVTLNLIINGSAPSSTDTLNACDSLTWVDGITYYSSNNSATYTYVGGSAAGCDSTVALNLTINTVNASVTQNGATLTADQNGANYQWLNCSGMTPVSGAINQTFTATSTGDYAVIVTYNGCTDTSICFTVTGLGDVENNHLENDIVVYPNPTQGNVFVDLGQVYPSIYLTLTDATGKTIHSKKYSDTTIIEMNIPADNGIYFLRISSEEQTAVIRIVKN